MSSGNVFERLYKLQANIGKLIVDGKRSPEEVCRVFQTIVDEATDKTAEIKPTNEELLADWSQFYKDVFSLDLDFSGIKIPDHKPGFDRLIIVAEGMTPQRIYEKCMELFPCWKYTNKNLDEFISSERAAKHSHYAVWLRDRQEADEENRNISADQLKLRGTPEITLEERMLYELKFFKETNGHLDKKNWTLCAGSRASDGGVSSAYWDGGRFGVSWDDAPAHDDTLRSRSAVS